MPTKTTDDVITKEVIRLGKYLNEITTIKDPTGKIIHKAVKPLMVEFHLKDVIQVIVGATILAIPIGFTEEVWILGSELPWFNIALISLLSFSFISLFVYYNYYRGIIAKHWFSFFQRVLSTYFIALIIVAVFLSVIDRVDWFNFFDLSLKMVVITALPASMSAVVADVVK